MKNRGSIRRTVSNNFYIMRFAWKLSPKRVLCAGIWSLFGQFEYLYFSGYFLKRVIALMEQNNSFSDIISFVFFTVALFFAIMLFNSWYENLLKPMTDVDIYKGLYHALYEKAGNAELSCFEDSEFYNQYMMAMADSDKRLITTIDNIWSILIGIFAVAVSWYMMVQIDPYVILFVIAPFIGNFVFAKANNKISYRICEESVIFKRIADYVNRVVHLADYAKELRMTNIFRVMQKKQRKAIDGMTDVMDKYAKKSILYGWGYLYFTFVIIFEGVIFYGAYRTMVSKTIPLSEFVILTSLMTSVSWILIGFTKSLISSFQNSLFIQKLREFMEYEPAIPEDTDGVMPDTQIHEIVFHNVSFSYKTGKPVLKNINLTLSEKETYALVGYNGAGKSTLIKLLMRLYDPTEGEIYVNGINIKNYHLKAYRALFAAAFQDGKIFARSVRDNVWMGKNPDTATVYENADARQKTAIDQIVWQALALAGMKEVIEKLPRGLDTVLTREFSKEGVVLSGGQYQKLIAARAFARSLSENASDFLSPGSNLNNAPIQIFDEPSSALDPIAEHDLMERIKRSGSDKILLLISHRLSSIQDVQKIILLKNGRIAEQGTHTDLMEQNGEYAALYRMQASKYRQSEYYCDPVENCPPSLQKGEA